MITKYLLVISFIVLVISFPMTLICMIREAEWRKDTPINQLMRALGYEFKSYFFQYFVAMVLSIAYIVTYYTN